MKPFTTQQTLYILSIAAGMFGAGSLVKMPHLSAFLVGGAGAACSLYLALARKPDEATPPVILRYAPTLTQAEWELMTYDTPIQPLSIPSEVEQRILDLVGAANCTPEQLAEILSPFLPTQSPNETPPQT